MNSIDALLDRLLLWQKFVLLAVVALVVALIPATLYLQQTTATVPLLEQIEGGAGSGDFQSNPADPATSRPGRAGAGGARSRAEAQRQAAAGGSGLCHGCELIGGMDNADLAQRWEQQQQRWQTLREALGGGQATVAQSYLLHTSLISGLLGA
jgi:hypothetical protein